MKNSYTSIDQSNELLKFGIDAGTADIHYENGTVAWSLSSLIELLPSGFIIKDTNGKCNPEKYYVWIPEDGNNESCSYHDSPLDAVIDKLIKINTNICDRCNEYSRCSKSNYIKSQCEQYEI